MDPFRRRTLELSPSRLVAAARSVLPFIAVLGVALGVHALLYRWQIDDGGVFFYSKILMDIGISIILAVSLTMVNGFTGQFSIGHAGFMAVGAYTGGVVTYYGAMKLFDPANFAAGYLSRSLPMDGPLFGAADGLFLAACLAAGLLAAGLGYLVGLPSLRLRGDYLAIVTLGFGEIVRVIIERSRNVLPDAEAAAKVPAAALPLHVGGASGFTGLQPFTSPFWVILLAGLTVVFAWRLKYSSLGRAMISIREDEIASQSMGVHVTRLKVMAFVVAAFFAGVAGCLYAHQTGIQLTPKDLAFQKSFDIVIMVVLGGMGSISGAVLAAAFVTALPEWLREPTSVWMYGLIALCVVAVFADRRLRAALWVVGLTAGAELLLTVARRAGIELSQYRMIIYALMLILVMIIRPQGLLGLNEVWEIGPFRRLRRTPVAPARGAAAPAGPGGSP
ncbi:MAG: branched-chain amino acid ABC transporter permease [Phycisphaerales bacterium]|nr:branched-chain amino acid ABC transporter permease [Phycisphaerales bacterium]